jgi:hypothetical protein
MLKVRRHLPPGLGSIEIHDLYKIVVERYRRGSMRMV